ncbi:MAG: hypothetical protein SWY16_14805 [Cyanobacteriota bacterium]|nr:hypothetical protein [Cyanobacteriota bacterium]
MSSVTQIICLANSWKRGDRCIAGIEPQTGRWIRPVSDLEDGRVGANLRPIDGYEPKLLDILEIPLASDDLDNGWTCEDRLILPGAWRKVGRVAPKDLLSYCSGDRNILHNTKKYVDRSFLQAQPFEKRRTLQLVQAISFSVRGIERRGGGTQWKGTIVTNTGQRLPEASITDPVLAAKLQYGYIPQLPCLVTISLSLPHRPQNWQSGDPCWKLMVGVIELAAEPAEAKTYPVASPSFAW